nr:MULTISPECIES: hypothetical protein [unclassified Saccharopolyspora]
MRLHGDVHTSPREGRSAFGVTYRPSDDDHVMNHAAAQISNARQSSPLVEAMRSEESEAGRVAGEDGRGQGSHSQFRSMRDRFAQQIGALSSATVLGVQIYGDI